MFCFFFPKTAYSLKISRYETLEHHLQPMHYYQAGTGHRVHPAGQLHKYPLIKDICFLCFARAKARVASLSQTFSLKLCQ